MAIDVETAAGQPKRARGDNGEYEQHSLPDQIAADKYASEQSAAVAPHRAIRFARMIPPGATDS